MYKVKVQIIDDEGAESFSAEVQADRDEIVSQGYATPGLKNVISVLTAATGIES